VVKGLFRVKALFSRNLGFWGWSVLASVLFFEHRDKIELAIEQGSPEPVLVSYGTHLGESIQETLTALQGVPSASGMEFVDIGFTVLAAGAHVLWYFKAFYVLSVSAFGENIPPIYIFLVSVVIYFLVVFAATGWVPDAGTFEALSNLPELLEFERASPLFDPLNGSNVTGAGNSSLRELV